MHEKPQKMKTIKNKKIIALFSAFSIILIVAYGFLFQRDETIQISRSSGHKRHLVRVLNVTIYTKNIDTELGEIVKRHDRVNAWEVTSRVKHRFGSMQTDCTVWATFEVEMYKKISKWREEGVKLPDQRRRARAYLDEGIANITR